MHFHPSKNIRGETWRYTLRILKIASTYLHIRGKRYFFCSISDEEYLLLAIKIVRSCNSTLRYSSVEWDEKMRSLKTNNEREICGFYTFSYPSGKIILCLWICLLSQPTCKWSLGIIQYIYRRLPDFYSYPKHKITK